jgi:hypothetical protein
MLIAAFGSFAVLLVAWALAPSPEARPADPTREAADRA